MACAWKATTPRERVRHDWSFACCLCVWKAMLTSAHRARRRIVVAEKEQHPVPTRAWLPSTSWPKDDAAQRLTEALQGRRSQNATAAHHYFGVGRGSKMRQPGWRGHVRTHRSSLLPVDARDVTPHGSSLLCSPPTSVNLSRLLFPSSSLFSRRQATLPFKDRPSGSVHPPLKNPLPA